MFIVYTNFLKIQVFYNKKNIIKTIIPGILNKAAIIIVQILIGICILIYVPITFVIKSIINANNKDLTIHLTYFIITITHILNYMYNSYFLLTLFKIT